MIVCTACGTRNEDGESFCGECGSYLEWEGERVGAPPEPAPLPTPEPAGEAAGPGFVQRVKTAVGIGEPHGPAAAAPAAEPAPGGPAPAAAAPFAPNSPPPPVPAEGAADVSAAPADSGAADTGAAALVVPLAPAAPEDHAPPAPVPGALPPAPTTPPPAAVRPGAAPPRPRRRELPPEERPPAPGETICGSCGAGNAPVRKFCRRCGADLADAPVAGRPPWWRRLFGRRQRSAPTAGTRPGHRARRSHRGLLTGGVIVVVLVVAALLTRSLWSAALNQARDRIQGTKIVNPTAMHASSSASGHGAAKIRDGAPNLYWAPNPKADSRGQFVQLEFASAYRLVYLRVFDGASDQLKDYLAQASAAQIEVTLIREGADPLVKHFTLDDKPGAQNLHIAVDHVTAVRVSIESAYRGRAGSLVAIGELEFLARK